MTMHIASSPTPPRRGLTRILLVAALLTGGMAALLGAAERSEPGAIHVVTVRQAITPATTSYIRRALERGIVERAECLIIQLDTPGGLLESTREIVQLLLNTRLPVVVYISPAGARGASAGTMITLASHVAAMAPATHIGAAHPVALFGLGGDNKVMGEKILNDTSAWVESIAELRGRNVEWYISAVRESKSITAQRALELNVVEIVADNLTDLVRQIDGKTVAFSRSEQIVLNTKGRPVLYRDMSFSQSFMSLLSNPNLIFLFLIIGLVGLYIEFSNPGLFLPGILGAISILIALIGMQTLPVSYGAL
ncbi:MAG: nodulation protein NfeD, partial [bacterium]